MARPREVKWAEIVMRKLIVLLCFLAAMAGLGVWLAHAARSLEVAHQLGLLWANQHVERGTYLLTRNRYDEADASFAQAISLAPHFAAKIEKIRGKDRIANGIRFLLKGQQAEAAREFTLALMHDPQAADNIAVLASISHNESAWNAFLAGRSESGLADAERAIELMPNDRNYLDTRGQIYLVLNRVEEAFTDLSRAIELGIESPGTFYSRGQIHERRNNPAAAAADYRRAVELKGSGTFNSESKKKAQERLTAIDSSGSGVH